MYWSVEEQCRRFTKRWMFIYVPFNVARNIVILLTTFYYIFVGNLDTSTWKTAFNHAVPFETKTLWKWYVLWIYQFNVGLWYAANMAVVTAYFTCCCFYLVGIDNHCIMLIESLQSDVDKNRFNKNQLEYWKNCFKIKEKLCEALKLHEKSFE